jgi:hypothetical protein
MQQTVRYSITSSARLSNGNGMLRSSVLAVLRLIYRLGQITVVGEAESVRRLCLPPES